MYFLMKVWKKRLWRWYIDVDFRIELYIPLFYARSLERLKILDENAELGILDVKVSDCLYKIKRGCGAKALHPFWKEIDMTPEQLKKDIR